MKLQLDNLVYTTTDETKIEELITLGATVLEKDKVKEVKEEGTEVTKTSNLKNLKLDDLRALATEKKIEFDDSFTKAQLIEKIEAIAE